MSNNEDRNTMFSRQIKSNIGPCMITFSIPLLAPGITLTVLGFGGEKGFDLFGFLHILGLVLLIVAIFLFIIGCVFQCSFTSSRIGPIEEIHRVVTTHDKMNLNENNSNEYQIKKTVLDDTDNNSLRRIYQNNDVLIKQHPSTSTSSSVPKPKRQASQSMDDKTSKSVINGSYKSNDSRNYSEENSSVHSKDKSGKQDILETGGNYEKDTSNFDNNPDHPNLDLYPLGRLPSLDLKHTKYSYSSQDKPDEEMSIIDETTGPCHSPDMGQSEKRHLENLPDLYGGTRRTIMSREGSYYDTSSFTSSDSISGHIIRTSRDEYDRKDSEHFAY